MSKSSSTNPFFSQDASAIFDPAKISEFYKTFDMSKLFDFSKIYNAETFNPSSFAQAVNQNQSQMAETFSKPFSENIQKMQQQWQDVLKSSPIGSLPFLNIESLMSIQHKNFEVFSEFFQSYFEALQSLWRKQADGCRQVIEDLVQMSQALASYSTPQERAVKQAEMSKAAMEKYMATLRDAQETFARYNTQAVETVGERVNQSLSEVYDAVKNMSSKAA